MRETLTYSHINQNAQTELLSQTQAEQLLQQFVETPLNDNELLSWKSKFRILVRKRLTKEHPYTYFHSLNVGAETLVRQKKRGEEIDVEKEALLNALLSYEFAHRDEIPKEIKGYNKTVFARFLLTRQTDDNRLGKTAKNCVDQLSLQELSDPIFNPPKRTPVAKNDKLLVSELAIKRISKEPDLAKTILDSSVTDFIRNLYQDFSRVQSTTYTASYSLLCYSPELADYIVQKLAIENHQLLSQFFTIYERYKDKKPNDAKDLNERDIIENIKQTFGRSSCLQSLYTQFQEESRRQELEKSEQAEKIRLEEAERVQRKEEEETRKQHTKKINELIELLPKYQTKPDIIKYSNANWDEERILLHPFKTEMIVLDYQRWTLIGLNEEIMVLLTSKNIQNEKIVQLANLWGNISKQMVQKIEETYRKQTPIIVQYEINNWSSSEDGNVDAVKKRWDFFNQTLTSFSDQLQRIRNIPTSSQAENPLLNNIEHAYQERVAAVVDAMQTQKPILEKDYINRKKYFEEQKYQADETAKKQKEEELQENIYELKKERSLEEIENKTKYLKSLYTLHTGLDLHHVDVKALDESGTAIGSVSFGLSQGPSLSQRQELTLEKRLEFKNEEDQILLEMGESLEMILKRRAMVDWVAAHEIAHLIDWASGHFTEKALHANITQSQIDHLITTFTPEQQSLAKEMITGSIKESFIDGLGFYCGTTYGTSNIVHDNDQSKRVEDLTTAFCTTMEIVKNIIQKEGQDKASQSCYQVILLRFMATTRHLTKNVETNNLTESLATLNIAKNTLTDCFNELNENTRFISEEQKEKLVDLFYQWFKGGESFLKDDAKQ